MSVTLDATPGGASANSYGTLAEANAYFDGRPGASAWTGAADDDARNQALVAACARLEQEDYDGVRVSATQALKHPRIGLLYDAFPVSPTAVHPTVKQAQFEEALAWLQNTARMDRSALERFSSVAMGPMTVQPRVDAPQSYDLTPTTVRLLAWVRAAGDGMVEVWPG